MIKAIKDTDMDQVPINSKNELDEHQKLMIAGENVLNKTNENLDQLYDKSDEHVNFALMKLNALDEVVFEFSQALNDKMFMLGVLYNRDKISLREYSLQDQKNFKMFILTVIDELKKHYTSATENIEETLDNTMNIKNKIFDKSTKSSENSSKILTEERFKYPIEIDEKYFPTSLKELELLENIVKNKEPNLFDILKLENKCEKDLKLQRRKVTKILKILNSIEIVHPTLKSININNMIGQKAPFVTNKDKLLTIYNTSTTWTNWSNYNSLWAKVLNGVDIPSCLEAFVIKEFFQNSVRENNMKTISSLIEHHATALVDDTLLDPFHPDYFANLFLQVTTTFGTSHLSHTQDAAFNKYLLLLTQDNVVKNKRRYQSIINKLESSILKQCLNCIQEIVFKNCVLLEKQIKLYIHYCFSGQYIPFLKRPNNMKETTDNKVYFQEQLINKSKFFFESMLLKDSEFIIPDPEHICVVFHHDNQTYEGRYLPTNEKLDFVINKQNGHFAEQLLALEIKNGGIIARIEDTIKQKPYIIVERKSDLVNEKKN